MAQLTLASALMDAPNGKLNANSATPDTQENPVPGPQFSEAVDSEKQRQRALDVQLVNSEATSEQDVGVTALEEDPEIPVTENDPSLSGPDNDLGVGPTKNQFSVDRGRALLEDLHFGQTTTLSEVVKTAEAMSGESKALYQSLGTNNQTIPTTSALPENPKIADPTQAGKDVHANQPNRADTVSGGFIHPQNGALVNSVTAAMAHPKGLKPDVTKPTAKGPELRVDSAALPPKQTTANQVMGTPIHQVAQQSSLAPNTSGSTFPQITTQQKTPFSDAMLVRDGELSLSSMELRPASTPVPTVQTQSIGANSQPAIAKQVAMQIAETLRNTAERPIEIALNPAELGRVRMTVMASEGVVSLQILAERPETLDLMRKHQEILTRDLQDLGFSSIDLAFGQGKRETAEEFGTSGMSENADLDAAQELSDSTPILRLDGSERVDIRV